MYQRIMPDHYGPALRALAKGKATKIAPKLIVDYFLALDREARAQFEASETSDFVRFAKTLLSLPDDRQTEGL